MSQQPYYVPESSKLPFAMAITMLVFIIGAANTVIDLGKDTNSYLILILSMIMLWTTMYFWFKQVIQENHAGLNNPMLKDSYVYGMAWFIFSEVMFFFAFFFALAYIRNFAVPWLGGEGEKGLARIENLEELVKASSEFELDDNEELKEMSAMQAFLAHAALSTRHSIEAQST